MFCWAACATSPAWIWTSHGEQVHINACDTVADNQTDGLGRPSDDCMRKALPKQQPFEVAQWPMLSQYLQDSFEPGFSFESSVLRAPCINK